MELLLHTAALPWSSGLRDCCCTWAHYLRVEGCGCGAKHYRTGLGQWAAETLSRRLGASWGWNCYYALPSCLGAVGRQTPTAVGVLPPSSGAVGSRTLAAHCRSVVQQWEVGLLLHIAQLSHSPTCLLRAFFFAFLFLFSRVWEQWRGRLASLWATTTAWARQGARARRSAGASYPSPIFSN